MGFLSDDERDQLRIASMSLHVVGEGAFEPQPAVVVEHEAFFLARVTGTDTASVYRFKEISNARTILESMCSDTMTFEAGAQSLAHEFSRQHGSTSRDGAFFIFDLRINDPSVRIYSLVKYDYSEVIEQSQAEDGKQKLRRIVHALVDDKKAIQKSALIRVVDGDADALISARDRTKPAPEIADYFATFLDVERSRDDRELNQSLVDVLRKALLDCKDVLPEKDAARALQRAKGFLRDRPHINEDEVFNAIVAAAGHPEDEPVLALLHRKTSQKIKANRLTGLEFRPDRGILRQPALRKIRTTEGVTVTYPDEVNAVTVTRVRVANGEGEVITITTDRIVEDTVVPDRAR